MHILLCDEHATNALSARKFNQFGYTTFNLVGTYQEGLDLIRQKSYDVVLVDLMLPVNPEISQSSMPLGIFLALFAAERRAKHIGVLSDADSEPALVSPFFGPINQNAQSKATFLRVNEATLMLSNDRELMTPFARQDPSTPITWQEYEKNPGNGIIIKNWDEVFKILNP